MEDINKESDLDDLTAELTKIKLQPNEAHTVIQNPEDFLIEIQGQRLTCNKELLINNSKFFEGFFNFEPDRQSIQIAEGGGLNFASCQQLVQFWTTSHLEINSSNAQELLLG